MTAPAVAVDVASRLDGMLRALSGRASDPPSMAAIRRLTDDAFPRSLDDGAHLTNALNPGGLPIEVSFAEATPRTLRCDVARGHPDVPLAGRYRDALRVASIPPAQAARWAPYGASERFGGFVSAALTNDGAPARFKAYLEVVRTRDVLAALSRDTTAHAALLDAVPGLVPHFVALVGGDPDPRLYYECANGVALTALVEWAKAFGLTRQALAAVHVTRRLTGAVVLPEAGVMCALRTTPGGIELKLELTRAVLPDAAVDALRAVLVERPRSELAFGTWCAALGQDVRPTVVSVRIATDLPTPLLSVYTGLLP